MIALRRAGLLLALLLVGCGGTSGHPTQPPRKASREEGSLATRSRIAYFDLATASGALRAAAAREGMDGRRPSSRGIAQLRASARLLRGLSAPDAQLGSINVQLIAAISAFMRAQAVGPLRPTGRLALRATDSVNHRLARYLTRHPVAAPAIPE